ncbi:MAG: glycosyltransferase family 9 protein [Verrucomicrobiales bacterium]|nr:glycosyltransferase family 9 protein [Verrucomicrobiales bacterium]
MAAGGSDKQAAESWPQLAHYDRLMIVKPSSLGDVVHALPAVALLKQRFPQLRVSWLANTEWMPLLEGSQVVDEVVEFPRRSFRGLRGKRVFLNWVHQFALQGRRAQGRELVIDFQGLLRSGIVSRLRGGREVLGMTDAREGARTFHRWRVPVKPEAHAVDRYLAVVEALSGAVDRSALPWELPEGRPPIGWPEGKRPLVLHPYSRGAGKALDQAQVAGLLRRWKGHAVVLAGRAEETLRLPGDWPGVVDLTNQTTLPELIWLLRQAACVVSVDSGPMHISAAVNPRTLGIHRWSDPRRVGPYAAACRVWKAGRIDSRSKLTDVECATDAPVDETALDQIAQWALTTAAWA